LFGHFERAVVPSVDDFEGFVVYLFVVMRPEPGRSFSARNCAHLQDRSTKVRGFGEGVDEEVRDALISKHEKLRDNRSAQKKERKREKKMVNTRTSASLFIF